MEKWFLVLILALIAIHIVPIWGFKFFPSQDGPSHLESAFMLRHYWDDSFSFRSYYEVNSAPVPTWFSHAILAGLMFFLPPLVAEKTLITAYIIAFTLSVFYFLSSFGKEKTYFSLLALAFTYNFFLHAGFYNFCFSIAFMIFALGYWNQHRDKKCTLAFAVKINVLLTIIYFCHVLTQLITLGSILLLTMIHSRWQLRKVLRMAGLLIPSYFLPIYYVRSQEASVILRFPIAKRLSRFAYIDTLHYFDPQQRYLGLALGIVFALGLAISLGASLRRNGIRRHSESKSSKPFLILALVLLLVYLIAPRSAYGGSGLLYRLIPLPYLIMIPCLDSRMWRSVRVAMGTAAVVIILIQVGLTVHYYRVLNHELKIYTSGASMMERRGTFIALNFDHRGPSDRVQPFRHASGYYTIATGLTNIANYEAAKGYFPIAYRPHANPYETLGKVESTTGNVDLSKYPIPIDYVILWKPTSLFQALSWIEKSYGLIYSNDGLRIYKSLP